jgi:hypothetical protein
MNIYMRELTLATCFAVQGAALQGAARTARDLYIYIANDRVGLVVTVKLLITVTVMLLLSILTLKTLQICTAHSHVVRHVAQHSTILYIYHIKQIRLSLDSHVVRQSSSRSETLM